MSWFKGLSTWQKWAVVVIVGVVVGAGVGVIGAYVSVSGIAVEVQAPFA